VSRVR